MIIMLYRIDNEIVFYSPFLEKRRTELCKKIESGTSYAYDVFGNLMDKALAISDICKICDRQTGTTMPEKILANLRLVDVIIALVRSEMIDLPNGHYYLQKLSNVVAAMSTGMFSSAAYAVTLVEPDEFLTPARLEVYKNILLTSDAIH